MRELSAKPTEGEMPSLYAQSFRKHPQNDGLYLNCKYVKPADSWIAMFGYPRGPFAVVQNRSVPPSNSTTKRTLAQ